MPGIVFLPLVLALIYLGGLAGFFRWEEKAPTKAEFFRRADIRNKVYAPLSWLKDHDPSGAVLALVRWEHGMCHNQSFDVSRLP